MLAGFAGSVELGFTLIEDMRQAWILPDKTYWFPRAATYWWRRRARRIFSHCSSSIRRLGCSILVVGPDPHVETLHPRTRCIRMSAPHFDPEYLAPIVWHSIGNGSSHTTAAYFADEYKEHYIESFAQFEVGSNPGGATFGTAGSVHRRLMEDSMESVSEALVFGNVFLDRCTVSSFRSTQIISDHEKLVTAPGPLIGSWTEFQNYARRVGKAAASAVA
jgi:hypothetical protein